MTKLQATSSIWQVTTQNFIRWCNDNGIDLTGKKVIHCWFKATDPTQIERLEVVPDLTSADIAKILAKWPDLNFVNDWEDSNNWIIP